MKTKMTAALGPSFHRLAGANLFAQLAEQLALAAAPMVAVLALGATVAQTGGLQAVLTLPFLLLALPMGLVADRMSRALLMVSAEAVRAVAMVAIVVLLLAGELTLPMLAVLGFVGVSATVAFSVASPAIVPALVPTSQLSLANSRIEVARTSAYTAGPAIGGLLVGWAGGEAAFVLAAVLSLLAALLLRGIPHLARPKGEPMRPLADIAAGLRFVSTHQLLAPIFLTQFVFNAGFFMILAVFVPYSLDHLALSASETGLVLGMFGAGMVVGALCAPAVMRRLYFGQVVGVGPFSGLLGAALIASTTWSGTAVVAALGFFLLGAGPVLWVISTTTLRQAVTPDVLLGRVSAVNILAYGARPVGAGAGALIGGLYGADAALLAAVGVFTAQATIIVLSPVVRLREQPARAV